MKLKKQKKNPMEVYDIEALQGLHDRVCGSKIGNPFEAIGSYDSFCVWVGGREVTKTKESGDFGYDLWFDGHPVASGQTIVDAISFLSGIENRLQ